MAANIIAWVIIIILLCYLFYKIGAYRESRGIHTMFKEAKMTEAAGCVWRNRNAIRANKDFLQIIAVTLSLLVSLCFSYGVLRNEYINKYRDGKIYREVKYHYEAVNNGTPHLKDSVVTYKKRK